MTELRLGIRKKPAAFARVRNTEQPSRLQIIGANKLAPSVTDFEKFMEVIYDRQLVSTGRWTGLHRLFF